MLFYVSQIPIYEITMRAQALNAPNKSSKILMERILLHPSMGFALRAIMKKHS